MRHNQVGAALIVVLMIIVLITMIGLWAIRSGISSLKIFSNQQVTTLLLQNTDATFLSFQNPSKVNNYAEVNGIVGFFRNPVNQDRELVLCFTDDDSFNLENAAWLDSQENFQKLSSLGGPCDEQSNSDGRAQVLTQVNMRRVASANNEPFADFARGTDVLTAKIESSLRLEMQVVSVMKGFVSNADDLFDKEQGCLYKRMDAKVDQVGLVKCLQDKGIVHNAQVAQYRFLSDFEPAGSQP